MPLFSSYLDLFLSQKKDVDILTFFSQFKLKGIFRVLVPFTKSISLYLQEVSGSIT